MTKLPETPILTFAKRIASAITYQHGHLAYIVGGYYRDYMLELDPHDVDMTTPVLPDALERTRVLGAHTVATGKDHGTISFVDDSTGLLVEVTTTQTRIENSEDRKGSEVVFLDGDSPSVNDPFKIDAQRRDLTINSLMYDPISESVVDYVGGLQDLKQKILRFNDNPVKVVRGDALRLLRMARIYTKLAPLGFTLDPRIFDIAEDPVILRRLRSLSAERVRDEFLKILSMPSSEEIARTITLLDELNVIDVWFPELSNMKDVPQNVYHTEDVWGHSLLALTHTKPRLVDRLFALFHDTGKPDCAEFKADDYGYSFHNHEQVSSNIFRAVTKRLKFGKEHSGDFNVNVGQIAHLIEHHMDAFVEGKTSRMMKRLGVDKWGVEMIELSWDVGRSDFFGKHVHNLQPEIIEKQKKGDARLKAVREKIFQELERQQAKKVSDLSIGGRDVMNLLNISPSRRVGSILTALFEMVVDEGVPDTKEDLTLELSYLHRFV